MRKLLVLGVLVAFTLHADAQRPRGAVLSPLPPFPKTPQIEGQIAQIDDLIRSLEMIGGEDNMRNMLLRILKQAEGFAGLEEGGGPAAGGQGGAFGDVQKLQKDIQAMFKLQSDMIQGIGLSNLRGTTSTAVVEGGRTGLGLVVPPPSLVDQLNLPADQGLVIQRVWPRTPAEKAGFRRNDILLEIAGKKVPNNLTLFARDVIPHMKNNEDITGVVLREGRMVDVKGLRLSSDRVVPPLTNEGLLDPRDLIQTVPGIGSTQPNTVRIPNLRLLPQNGTTVIVPMKK